MTNDEIAAKLDEEIRQSVGYDNSELSNQRKTALEYFYGDKFGNEVEGRSEYVSPDVRDTILWIMPSLMRIFFGGDHIVRFEPRGPDDVAKANQATDYVNYIFQSQNDGFLTMHTWFMDALLSKNGFVQVFWEEEYSTEKEKYQGLTPDEMAAILQDPEVEITGFDGAAGVVEVTRKKTSGQCRVLPVPPEEILVNRNPIAPLSANWFICHRKRARVEELKKMGYEVEGLMTSNSHDTNSERSTRYEYDETDSFGASGDYVWLEQCYVEMDFGNGCEKRTITKIGNKILDNVDGYACRLVTLTPVPLPHKLYGMSIADLIMDLQLLRSTVFRQIIDNMFHANNGRYMALDGMVNIDDLLTSRPGGIVRVKTFDAVRPLQAPLLGAPAFNLLNYLDNVKDVRTGVNRDLQGIDPDAINKTATAQSNRLGAAQSRIELIARIFAETGVKDLFYAILECVQKYQKKAEVVRLRNEWVPVDPREWTNKFDMSVAVGLGTGSKDSVIGALLETIKLQMASMQMGLPIVQPVNLYNAASELLKAQSIKGGDRFFTDPTQVPPQQPQTDPALIKAQGDAQTKLQLQGMKHQSAMEKQAMRQQHDAEKLQYQSQINAAKDANDKAFEASMKRFDAEVQRMSTLMEKTLDERAMKLDAALKALVEQSKPQVTNDAGRT